MGRIFGTDGARGVANTEISCKLATDLGRAAAMVLSERLGRKPTFLIGKDTRISSDMLEAAASAGLCSVGSDVVQIGIAPTPAVAYLVREGFADAGIMLSASHNSYEYNGIKIFGSDGCKLSDELEFEMEAIVLDQVKPYPIRWGLEVGRISRDETLLRHYIAHIAESADAPLSGMKIALDCANGSACATARELFAQAGAECVFLHDAPDGININHACGSTDMTALSTFVRENGFDAGFAFDGDADRCLAVDENGQIMDGDRLMAMLALHLQKEGKLHEDTVVATVMSNIGFFKFAQKHGIKPVTTKVGDRYVLQAMQKGGYTLGGEQSGHLIFRDIMPTGDGQLTAIQTLRILKQSGKRMSELAGVMQVYPQVLVNVRADSVMKSRLNIDEGVQIVIRRAQEQLGDDGRVLVRSSGTEPLIRVMVEGAQEDEIGSVAEKIAETISERLSDNEKCKRQEAL